ncbi:MAG TPA: hypothetical protein VLI93_05735, partial [Acetobacteraceae bacterium]|nr:hypothetical protein [Acetobacteraceae bacterium]
MFVRNITPTPDPVTTHPPPMAAKPAPRSGTWRRALKLTAALALLGSGLYATLSEHGLVSSNNAVVSAYVVSLRAPITGFVSGLALGVGDAVRRDQVIAQLDDPLLSDQH